MLELNAWSLRALDVDGERTVAMGMRAAVIGIREWMALHAITLLRVSVGIVFFWFGVLKFFPGLSPAEDLAARTISTMSFGLVTPDVSLPVLAAWECLIGLGFVSGRWLGLSLALMFLQMSGTILPLFFSPAETWVRFPYAATLEGQYIIKNVVLVSAAVVVAADRMAATGTRHRAPSR